MAQGTEDYIFGGDLDQHLIPGSFNDCLYHCTHK